MRWIWKDRNLFQLEFICFSLYKIIKTILLRFIKRIFIPNQLTERFFEFFLITSFIMFLFAFDIHYIEMHHEFCFSKVLIRHDIEQTHITTTRHSLGIFICLVLFHSNIKYSSYAKIILHDGNTQQPMLCLFWNTFI